MDLKSLIAKMDAIEKRKILKEAALTLQQVAAAEKAAAEAAAAKKKQGGFAGFTSWDPKTAGDIALSKLATDNKLPGLINSKGEFVVAGDGTQKPQVAPPNADDMKALAAAGLMPGNTQGPAALTKFLGDPSAAMKGQPTQADKELTQYKQQSGQVQGDRTSAAFIQDRLKKLNDLVTKISAAKESITFKSDIARSLVESFNYILTEKPTLGTGAPTTNPATGVTAGKFQSEVAEIKKLMAELADIDSPEVATALQKAQTALDKLAAPTAQAFPVGANKDAAPVTQTPAQGGQAAQTFPVSPQPEITRPQSAAGGQSAQPAAQGGQAGQGTIDPNKLKRFKELLAKAAKAQGGQAAQPAPSGPSSVNAQGQNVTMPDGTNPETGGKTR